MSMMEFNAEEVAVCKVEIPSNEVLRQIYFLRIYQIFSINNSSNIDFSWQLECGYGPLQMYFKRDF